MYLNYSGRFVEDRLEIKKQRKLINMVPIDRTLEKECFIYRYFFIYLNLKIGGLGERL